MPLDRRAYRISCIAIGFTGTVVALLLFFLSCLGINPNAEHLGIPITEVFAGQPIGHMSPVTAFCLVLTGLSFLASLYSSPGRPKLALADGKPDSRNPAYSPGRKRCSFSE